jgi:hypothetical protein
VPDDIIDLGNVDEPTRQPADEQADTAVDGVEIVVITDEQGRGVQLACAADLSPADLVESALNLIQQVTRAALNNPTAARAGDLGLGEDVPW